MTPEGWERINRIFEQAIDCRPANAKNSCAANV